MKKKFTKAKQFKLFKKTVEKSVKLFGLTQYNIHLIHGELGSEDMGGANIKELRKSVTIWLSNSKDHSPDDIKRTAVHEVLHLLTARMCWLATARYIENNDISEEDEAIVSRLEGFIFNGNVTS
ncbi:MAG TPA: hypothetical protein ENG14_02390 [Thermodesulforhabdus norvegica]|uniref:SprT-like family protein n=1 Tax=Thermodesulforhabdus norvegica TaxID=39841 RepID=A0A7C0WUD4_9BACT|nr:hypothetical protein [Thermodesulforhabdus norvegica]